jgi:hypothetical protein
MQPETRQRIWDGLLFILSAGYLVFELAFNSRIVDGASGSFNSIQLEAMELQGRILSGLGMTLLCLRQIKPEIFSSFVKRAVLISIFAFSFMFFGQKLLVDSLVNNSSEVTRVDAMHIALLKKGILNGSVQIADLDIPDEALDTPATNSLLAIMGIMIFNSNEFINSLKESSDMIIDELSIRDAQKTLPNAYTNYQQYQRSTLSAWDDYVNAVNRYNLEFAKIEAESRTKADAVYIEAATEFNTNQISLSKNERIRKSLEVKRAVSDYFEAKARVDTKCNGGRLTDESCHIKIEQVYRDTVLSNAGRYIAPDYWCNDPIEKRLTETIRGRPRTVTRTVQDCQSMDRKYIEKKLVALYQGGSSSFVDNPVVNSKVREQLTSEGIILDEAWTLNDKPGLIKSISQAARTLIKKEYENRILNTIGEIMPLTLSNAQFVALPMVQQPLKDSLQWVRPGDISMSLGPDAFLKDIHKLKYVEFYNDQKNQLAMNAADFGEGEIMEGEGKSYYRSIVVPPLAMAFSLIFGLLNLFSFLTTIVQWPLKSQFKAKLVAGSFIVAVFGVYPILASSPAVESKTFNFFSLELNKTTFNGGGEIAAWVINTQPIIYPLGHLLANISGQHYVEEYLIEHIEAGATLSKPIPQRTQYDLSSKTMQPQTQNSTVQELLAMETSLSPQEQTKTQNHSSKLVSEKASLAFIRQDESDGKHYQFSRELASSYLHSDTQIMFDISPIELPEKEKWVPYDKPYYGDDICINGRRLNDTLRNITETQWRVGYHGSCSIKSAERTHLPTLDSYLRNVARERKNLTVIVGLQEDITGEVYCHRYKSLANKVTDILGTNKLVFATSSISVLGCLGELPAGYDISFEFPKHSDSADTLFSDDHRYFTRAEYKRIRKLEAGIKPTLRSLNIKNLKLLLDNHPYLDWLIIDKPLITENVKNTLHGRNKTLLEMSGKRIQGVVR